MKKDSVSVLLVDDDPFAREIFVLVMEHHGIQVYPIGDATGALKFLGDNQTDIIMIDLFLPEFDGYQLLKQIRSKALAQDSKMVATTAYHTNDTAQEAVSRGFDGFVPKPFNAEDLVTTLLSVIQYDSKNTS